MTISDRLKFFEQLQMTQINTKLSTPTSTRSAPQSPIDMPAPQFNRVSIIKEALMTGNPVTEETLSRHSSVRERVHRINSSNHGSPSSARTSVSQSPVYQRSPAQQQADEALVKPSQLGRKASYRVNAVAPLSTASRPALASTHSNAATHTHSAALPATGQPPVNKLGGGNHSCVVCHKTVYFMDQLQIDSNFIHKGCLKCDHCKMTLKLGNYAALDGKYYCKPHFQQLFKLKGNYFEGFGREDIKKNWQ